MSKHHYYPIGSHCFSWCRADEWIWEKDGKPLPWFCIIIPRPDDEYDEGGFDVKIGKWMFGFI